MTLGIQDIVEVRAEMEMPHFSGHSLAWLWC